MINTILLSGDSSYLKNNVKIAIANNYKDITINESLEGASAFYECLTNKPDLIIFDNTIDNMQTIPNVIEFDKTIKVVVIIDEDTDVLLDLPYGVDSTIMVNSDENTIMQSLTKFIDK